MFTGIITDVGEVLQVSRLQRGGMSMNGMQPVAQFAVVCDRELCFLRRARVVVVLHDDRHRSVRSCVSRISRDLFVLGRNGKRRQSGKHKAKTLVMP